MNFRPCFISKNREVTLRATFNRAVDILQTLVIALGAGLTIWSAINLLEATATTIRAQKRRVYYSALDRLSIHSFFRMAYW